jgi:hypothetical protein
MSTPDSTLGRLLFPASDHHLPAEQVDYDGQIRDSPRLS